MYRSENCRSVVKGITVVYNLAADIGGMGFIESNRARCMLSVLTNTHMLMAANETRRRSVLLFFISMCICGIQTD